MSEKRKPYLTMLLRKSGKAKKIELFSADLWPGMAGRWYRSARYRIRVNGKWYPKGEIRFFYLSTIRDILWRSLKNI